MPSLCSVGPQKSRLNSCALGRSAWSEHGEPSWVAGSQPPLEKREPQHKALGLPGLTTSLYILVTETSILPGSVTDELRVLSKSSTAFLCLAAAVQPVVQWTACHVTQPLSTARASPGPAYLACRRELYPSYLEPMG